MHTNLTNKEWPCGHVSHITVRQNDSCLEFWLCKFQTTTTTKKPSKKNQLFSARWTQWARHLWCNEVLCVINYNGAEKAYDLLADCLSLSSAEPKLSRNYTCGCELRLIGHWIVCAVLFPPRKPLNPGKKKKRLVSWIPAEMGSRCRWLRSAFWSLSLTQTILFTRNKRQMSRRMCEWGRGGGTVWCRCRAIAVELISNMSSLKLLHRLCQEIWMFVYDPYQKGIGDLESKYRVGNEAC